jgi:hypothetical protein
MEDPFPSCSKISPQEAHRKVRFDCVKSYPPCYLFQSIIPPQGL